VRKEITEACVTDRWLLVETFGDEGRDPTVIALGQTPKRMLPLESVLGRGGYIHPIRAMIKRVAATGEAFRGMTRDGRRQLIADPLASFAGRVNGVYAWAGLAGQEPPLRALAGAWYFNRTTGLIGGSSGLLDLYGVAPQDRRQTRLTAEAFTRLLPGADETHALALLARAEPGAEYQGRNWTVRRDDGELRAVTLACRVVEEARDDGRTEVVVCGVTQDIGPAATTPAAPRPARVALAQRVIMAEREPGRHRAIVDLRTLDILRWIDEPPPGVTWEANGPHRPAIHRADLRTAVQMSRLLADEDRVEDTLRVRAASGGWMTVSVTAALMLLDQHTTAALVTVSPLS
jgi:hypothetical protein